LGPLKIVFHLAEVLGIASHLAGKKSHDPTYHHGLKTPDVRVKIQSQWGGEK